MGRVLILCTRGVCNAFMCSSAWLTNWLMDWLAVAGLTYSCGARGRLSGWFIGVLGVCRFYVWPWREWGCCTSNGLAQSGIAEQWETAAVLPWCWPLFIPLPALDPDRPDTVGYAWLHETLSQHNTKLLTQTHIITHMQSHRRKDSISEWCPVCEVHLLIILPPVVFSYCSICFQTTQQAW